MVFGSAVRQSARVFSSSARRQSAAVAASAATSASTPVRASAIQAWSSSSSSAAFATPQHYANDVTAVLAGVAVVGAVVGVGKMWWDASSSSGSAGSGAEITREDTARFFAELTAEVQNLFRQLPELEDAVRSYMKTNNIELTDEQFQQAMLQQLFQMMEGLEQEVVNRRQWSRKSLEQALEKFGEDEEIVALQRELQSIMQSVFPAPEAVAIPEHMTAEKTLAILTALVKGMELAMQETLKHAASEGITDAAKAMEEFQSLYLEQVELFTMQQMAANEISQEIFTTALQKFHQEDAQFRKQVEAIYAKQAKNFRKMGLEVHDES